MSGAAVPLCFNAPYELGGCPYGELTVVVLRCFKSRTGNGGRCVHMKLALKIVGGVVLVVAIVVGIALFRTSQFGAKADGQAAITLPEPPAVDVAAAAFEAMIRENGRSGCCGSQSRDGRGGVWQASAETFANGLDETAIRDDRTK